jgi:hypothetical protein
VTCLVILLSILQLSTGSSISADTNSRRSKNHIDTGRISTVNHRCLPQRQGNAVLVDSGTPYSGWTNIHHCLAFEPGLGALQFVNRNLSPTGHINVHQADAGITFWVHDMEVYHAQFGVARYPTSVASNNGPHIGFPVLDPGTGTWGHMGAQWCEGGWYSSFWASPVDMSGNIGSPRSIGVQLPTGDLVFVCDNTDNTIPYYTMSADLNTPISNGNLASNCQIWGIDCNGDVCHVFWYDLTDFRVYYRTTTDGITWTAETEWQLAYPQPYANNVLSWPQMAVTDAGNPILVFGLYNNDDDTYPFNSKVYVSNASGATPVEVSDNTYGVWSYPTICAGGGNIVVVMQVAMDTTLIDSLARHDIFCRASTDGGATWCSAINITEGVTNRPGLPQAAKRVDTANGDFFYFYGVNLSADHDPYFHVVYDPEGLDLHAWYVGWHEIPTGITEDNRTRTPQSTRVEVYPNPFRRTTTIRYTIHDPGYRIENLGLRIYDATGRVVKSVNLESCTLNHVSCVRWYGDDNWGRSVPAGVYFVKINNADVKLVHKIIRVE